MDDYYGQYERARISVDFPVIRLKR
jgi:hypothetical protein